MIQPMATMLFSTTPEPGEDGLFSAYTDEKDNWPVDQVMADEPFIANTVKSPNHPW